MDDCLFCKIVKGDIPCKKVYEDEELLAFLDINPSSNGDTLLIPKKHIVEIQEVDNDLLIKMHEVVKKIKIIDEERLSSNGFTIINNNGISQEVKHFHLHLTPIYNETEIIHKITSPLKELDEVQEIMTK